MIASMSIAAVVMGHIAHGAARGGRGRTGLTVDAWVIGYVGLAVYMARRAGR